MVTRLFSTAFKIAVASLFVGVILSSLNITAEQILSDVGVTPERVAAFVSKTASWAGANIVLGAVVILPVWFVIYLFRPPHR